MHAVTTTQSIIPRIAHRGVESDDGEQLGEACACGVTLGAQCVEHLQSVVVTLFEDVGEFADGEDAVGGVPSARPPHYFM